jgi:hypothetical protein
MYVLFEDIAYTFMTLTFIGTGGEPGEAVIIINESPIMGSPVPVRPHSPSQTHRGEKVRINSFKGHTKFIQRSYKGHKKVIQRSYKVHTNA